MAANKNIEFKMAPKLLLDVIRKQAGTLAKAIVEGVMNSADAGAKACNILINGDKVQILDDGKGFKNAKEVEEWFGTFGAPHAEEEEKVYGTFRMGRGQMFSFGRNTWNTGRYTLRVDVEKSIGETGRISYDMTTSRTRRAGCCIDIDLYKPLRTWAVDDTVREVTRACKYMPNIEVYINDKLISVDPATEEWDLSDGEIYLRLKDTGPLTIYSKGVFVSEKSSYLTGSGGDVIAVNGFSLNFARNAVLEYDCDRWVGVLESIRNTAHKKALKAARLTSAAKQRYSLELGTHRALPEHVNTLKIITSVKGSSYTVKRLFDVLGEKYSNRIAVAPKGCPRGDKVMQSGLAFVLSKDCADRFKDKDVHEIVHALLTSLEQHCPDVYDRVNPDIESVEVDDLLSDNDSGWRDAPEKEAAIETQTWMKLLREFSKSHICSSLVKQYAETPANRAVHLGTHFGLACAWTDGRYLIHFDEAYLKYKSLASIQDTVQVAATLWHEYVHGDTTCETHVHGEEFYERFHDGAEHFIGQFLAFRTNNLPRILDTMGRRETKRLKKIRETSEKILDKATRFEESTFA